MDKNNEKEGIAGRRIIHVCCGVAGHAGIHTRANKAGRPDWAQEVLRGSERPLDHLHWNVERKNLASAESVQTTTAQTR